MVEPADVTLLDAWLDPSVRESLEARFWRPIAAQATLEILIDDPSFATDPGRHPAMFADHGVVHARDVAAGLLRLVDVVDGVLVPCRPADRLAFVKALGVALVYLHDVGMIDMSADGRRIHAQVASHIAFRQDADSLVACLLAPGPVRERLESIQASAPLHAPLDVVARELLALCVAHSKSVVPCALLDDREALRELLRRVVFTPLEVQRAAGGPDPAWAPERLVNTERYPDPASAFAWLTAGSGAHAQLADDAVDTLRVLRAADVLRQRGTVLRTSGGFEVSMDAETAMAVCTLRPATGDAAYVIRYDDPRGAGEADIREAVVTGRGDLRIAFHRGAFGSEAAEQLAVASVAGVVVDIQGDVLPSFSGRHVGGGVGPTSVDPSGTRILLERPGDRPAFADEVAREVVALEPRLAGRVVAVADVADAAPIERARFHAATRVAPDSPAADRLLCRLSERGADTHGMDRDTAFAEVGRATLRAGETLVEAGSSPAFVYVPLGEGLVVRPGGGYPPAPLPAWVPVGTTGAIRRAERNSAIVAEQEVEVVMIPSETYVRAWLRPLRPDELVARLRSRVHA